MNIDYIQMKQLRELDGSCFTWIELIFTKIIIITVIFINSLYNRLSQWILLYLNETITIWFLLSRKLNSSCFTWIWLIFTEIIIIMIGSIAPAVRLHYVGQSTVERRCHCSTEEEISSIHTVQEGSGRRMPASVWR